MVRVVCTSVETGWLFSDPSGRDSQGWTCYRSLIKRLSFYVAKCMIRLEVLDLVQKTVWVFIGIGQIILYKLDTVALLIILDCQNWKLFWNTLSLTFFRKQSFIMV